MSIKWGIFPELHWVLLITGNLNDENSQTLVVDGRGQRAKFSEIWIKISVIFIQANAFENVICKMVAILS